jgi:aminodeoxychorismate lyase
VTKSYINGSLESPEKSISIDERGFRFGDGVFETIPVQAGVPYLWEYHMERLEEGLAAIHIQSPADNVFKQATDLIKINNIDDGLIRIYISRGIGSQGYLPVSTTSPTVIIQTMERPRAPDAPVTLWLSTYEKISKNALPTHCKTAQGLNSTLARMEAVNHACYDALQLDCFGRISETSASNIFWLAKNILYTPSLACSALAGITRRRIIELSPYPINEGCYSLEDLQAANAVIITNASIGIVPVKAFLPAGITWQSDTLAKELINLRNQDITLYTQKKRELLA